jgi:hypothetical protein
MKLRTKQNKRDFLKAVLSGDQRAVRSYMDFIPNSWEFREGKVYKMYPEREVTKEGFIRLYNPEHDLCFFDSNTEYEQFKKKFTGIGFDVSATYNPAGLMAEIRKITFYE